MTKKGLFFTKVNNTWVIPVRYKIILVFALFILVSNFASNYINLMFSMEEQMKLGKQLLAKDLKDLYSFTSTQYDIYNFNKDKQGVYESIVNKATYEMERKGRVFLAITPDGTVELKASKTVFSLDKLSDADLKRLQTIAGKEKNQGFFKIENEGKEYFGVFKFNDKWNMYLYLAEEYGEFTSEANYIFLKVSIIIFIMTLLCTFVGIYAVRYILRYIKVITDAIMEMVKTQRLDVINLKQAPNDDITYMGMAFNSLSSSIDTLLRIFKKFANQDVAIRAYRDKEIKLEGNRRELTILFSDIKSFTFITETLGNDIIKLINMHYDRAIREVVRYDGAIGSIIGDAILAMFGTIEEEGDRNKSYSAVMAAYELQAVAESLRQLMMKKRAELLRSRTKLSEAEEQVYKAVLLEIGVGIDGGEVFYGNIGSYVRMTNTVIGDNVNAASRLEGLTRIYKVPVICSEYVKEDIENNVPGSKFRFIEIDTVMVKGKTEGKKVFWPIPPQYMSKKLDKQVKIFEAALVLYYDGEWKKALTMFRKSGITAAQTFIERIKGNRVPRGWNGIWQMKTK